MIPVLYTPGVEYVISQYIDWFERLKVKNMLNMFADPQNTAPYFMEMGMHCLFCPASRGETLEEACAVHGVPVEEMLEKLNKHFAE